MKFQILKTFTKDALKVVIRISVQVFKVVLPTAVDFDFEGSMCTGLIMMR